MSRGKQFSMTLVRGPLINTPSSEVVGPDASFSEFNCDPYSSDYRSRPGIDLAWRRDGASDADIVWGSCTASYRGYTETLIVIQQYAPGTGLQPKAKVVVLNLVTGATLAGPPQPAFLTDAWQQRDPSHWEMWQREGVIYALNEVDGLWAKQIGDYSETAWRRSPIVLSDIARPDGRATWERPDTNATGQLYPTEYWGSGDLALSLVSGSNGPGGHGGGGAVNTATVAADAALIYTAGGTDTGHERPFYIYIGGKLTASRSFTARRCLEALVSVEATSGAHGRATQNPFLDLNKYPLAYVSTDAAATIPAPGGTFDLTKWKPVTAYWGGEVIAYDSQNRPAACYVGLNLDTIRTLSSANGLDQIRQIAFAIPVVCGNTYVLSVGSPSVGGTWMSAPGDGSAYLDGRIINGNSTRNTDPIGQFGSDIRDIEYKLCYYRADGSESAAEDVRFSGIKGLGLRSRSALFLGCKLSISIPACPTGAGYVGYRVWRRRHSHPTSPDCWVLIEETATTSDAITYDSLVDAVDCVAWPTVLHSGSPVADRPATHDWGGTQTDITGISGATWRGSNVFGKDGLVYISDRAVPHSYVKPASSYRGGVVLAVDDDYVGNTVAVGGDLSDQPENIRADEVLYVVGRSGVYAGVGVLPKDIDALRKLPGSKGQLNRGASAIFRGGLLVASPQGLYWYTVKRGYALDQEGTYPPGYLLTKDIERSWKWLLGQSAADLRVFVIDDEIWVVKGAAYIMRGRNEVWAQGAFTIGGNGNATATPEYSYPGGALATECAVALTGLNGIDQRFPFKDTAHTGEIVYMSGSYHPHFVTKAGHLYWLGTHPTTKVPFKSDDGVEIPGYAEPGTIIQLGGQVMLSQVVAIPSRVGDVGSLRVVAETRLGSAPSGPEVVMANWDDSSINQGFILGAAAKVRIGVSWSSTNVSVHQIMLSGTLIDGLSAI